MKAFTDWQHLSFAYPLFFVLLLIIPFMIWWEVRGRKNKNPSLRLTTINWLPKNSGLRAKYIPTLLVLRIIAIAMLIVALARPQSSNTTTNNDSEGIDIVLSMDISGSMQAMDFKPNRIEAAKKVALDFVDKRPTDRIGLVIFAGESFTMCPITIDHPVLKEQISQVKDGLIQDGTSIGMGLATAVDRLRNSKAKSKVIILMTDGVNNMGLIDPQTALEIAKAYKVRVYTVGIGTQGEALMPIPTPPGMPKQTQMQPVQIDEALLKQIASQTGGKYFRATGNTSLERVYDDINSMEKTKVEMTSYKHYAELFFPFAMIAIACLMLELLLRYTVFKTIT